MLTITNLTKKKAPVVPFLKLAGFVLGKKYELSLVLTGDALIKKLNNTYRRKNQPTNILSFPYSETEGEIFINLKRAELESKRFERNFNHHLAYLFIHGLLHLKGFAHGSKMESEECKILKHFKKSLRTF